MARKRFDAFKALGNLEEALRKATTLKELRELVGNDLEELTRAPKEGHMFCLGCFGEFIIAKLGSGQMCEVCRSQKN